MSDIYTADILLTTTYTDVTVAYPAMANVQSWVQNRGPQEIVVAYTASSTAPAGGGAYVPMNESWGGSAAHIWVKTLNGTSTCSVGVL